MKVEVIIIGQGLAGTLLAFELLKRGQSFIVIDRPVQAAASSVAAGIINPVVFRRMTKSWKVDEAFPVMETVYHELEELLNISIYNRCRILKILDNESRSLWKEKVITHQLDEYLENEPDLSFHHPPIHTPYGVGIVKKAGRLDIRQLVVHFHHYLERQQCLRTEVFDIESLSVNPQQVHYKDLTALKIIFCEGSSVSKNPYFSGLKFKHSKGETLEVSIPDLHIDEIINGEVFLMPSGAGHFKVGATYRWDETDENTTIAARQELLAKLETMVLSPVEIISQQAGIRPIAHDRHPVIGIHPHHPSMGILNGLGSKGALLGPWLARLMADYLLGNTALLPIETDVKRYFK
ncbi:MAG: NAD(P)/FAD-dependent oxidoreductase [Candidatus Saccharibacteria bacterium]